MQTILCVALGYFIGQINPSYLLARRKGFDIRSRGSGNAGASNAVVTLGITAGIICALFDISKSFLVVKLAFRLFPRLSAAGMIAGTACILGHIFPLSMKFHGGKGLACLGGVVLAHNAGLFLCLLLLEVFVVFITNYLCFVPVSGSILFFAILLFTGYVTAALVFLPAMVAILYRHLENFKRILQGSEAHFSYLWDKENETRRLEENTGISHKKILGE